MKLFPIDVYIPGMSSQARSFDPGVCGASGENKSQERPGNGVLRRFQAYLREI